MGCSGSKTDKVFALEDEKKNADPYTCLLSDERANVDLSTRLLLEKLDDVECAIQKHAQNIAAELQNHTLIFRDIAAGIQRNSDLMNDLLQESKKQDESSSEEEESLDSEEEKTSFTAGYKASDKGEEKALKVVEEEMALKVLEEEKARKIANLIKGEVVVTGYVLKDSANKPIARIGGMIVGTHEGIPVVVFLGVKHTVSSEDMGQEVSAIIKVENYWQELKAYGEELKDGFPQSFNVPEEDKNLHTAYQDLHLSIYGRRHTRWAIGARVYSQSARNYMRRNFRLHPNVYVKFDE